MTQSRLNAVKDELADAAGTVAEHAAGAAEAALDVAASRIESAREKVAETGETVGAKLREAADADDAAALQARVLGSLADGISAASSRVRDLSLSEIAEEMRVMARRHPGLFVAGAAVAGFAVARFLRAGPSPTGSGRQA